MGEAMGPNTIAALHAGADHMKEYIAELEGRSGGDATMASASQAEIEDEEEAELRALRAARLQALKEEKASARFGVGVKHIGQSDWRREVVDMSQSRGGTWVVVHLAHDANPMCGAVLTALDELARRHPAVSFVSVAAASMMPADQFRLLPAVFCYWDGTLKERLISRQLVDPGTKPSPDELEWKLAGLAVLDSDFDEPPPPPQHSRGEQWASQRPNANRVDEEGKHLDNEVARDDDDNDLDWNDNHSDEDDSDNLGVD